MLNREFPLPQLLFFFDAEPEITLARIKTRSTTEIYENISFLKKTTDAYRSVISDYQTQHTGMEIVRLDAAGSIEKTAQIIWSYIEKLPILKP
jgi:dTMP kinase